MWKLTIPGLGHLTMVIFSDLLRVSSLDGNFWCWSLKGAGLLQFIFPWASCCPVIRKHTAHGTPQGLPLALPVCWAGSLPLYSCVKHSWTFPASSCSDLKKVFCLCFDVFPLFTHLAPILQLVLESLSHHNLSSYFSSFECLNVSWKKYFPDFSQSKLCYNLFLV